MSAQDRVQHYVTQLDREVRRIFLSNTPTPSPSADLDRAGVACFHED